MSRRRSSLVLAAALVLFALPARAQRAAGVHPLPIPPARDFDHHATIWTEFHGASGYGSVELRPMPVADAPPAALRAMFVYQGEHLTAPPAQVSVALLVRGDAERYADVKAVAFDLGGATLPAGPVIHQSAADPSGGVSETVAWRMPASQFLRVVNARTAALRVGATTIPLGTEAREALADFASRMAPATFERALAALQATTQAQGFTIRKAWYEPTEVDVRAAPTFLPARPAYPAVPPEQRRVRTVNFSYVVDSAGKVELETLRPAAAGDSAFVEAIRAVADRWEFSPATKGGRRVRQLVRQAMLFEP